jgi:hypothetical protein
MSEDDGSKFLGDVARTAQSSKAHRVPAHAGIWLTTHHRPRREAGRPAFEGASASTQSARQHAEGAKSQTTTPNTAALARIRAIRSMESIPIGPIRGNSKTKKRRLSSCNVARPRFDRTQCTVPIRRIVFAALVSPGRGHGPDPRPIQSSGRGHRYASRDALWRPLVRVFGCRTGGKAMSGLLWRSTLPLLQKIPAGRQVSDFGHNCSGPSHVCPHCNDQDNQQHAATRQGHHTTATFHSSFRTVFGVIDGQFGG